MRWRTAFPRQAEGETATSPAKTATVTGWPEAGASTHTVATQPVPSSRRDARRISTGSPGRKTTSIARPAVAAVAAIPLSTVAPPSGTTDGRGRRRPPRGRPRPPVPRRPPGPSGPGQPAPRRPSTIAGSPASHRGRDLRIHRHDLGANPGVDLRRLPVGSLLGAGGRPRGQAKEQGGDGPGAEG